MTVAGLGTVTSLQGTVAEGASACSKLPGAGRNWHKTWWCRMQAPSCRHILQQPPCLLTAADWAGAVADAGMHPLLFIPRKPTACTVPAAWHWSMGGTDHTAPRLQVSARDLNLLAISGVIEAACRTLPEKPEEIDFAMVLWNLQLEFPGCLAALLQTAAALHRALPSTPAAHRTAHANALYLQGIMGYRILPVLLGSLRQTAAQQPAGAQRVRQLLKQGHLGAAVLQWDCLETETALEKLNVQADSERNFQRRKTDAEGTSSSDVSS